MIKKIIISFSIISFSISSFALDSSYDPAFQRMMNSTISGVVANKYATTQTPAIVNSTVRSMTSTLQSSASKIAAGTAVVGGVAVAAVSSPSFLFTVAAMTASSLLINGSFKLLDKYVLGPGGVFTSTAESPSQTTAGLGSYWYTTISLNGSTGYVYCDTAEQCAWQYVQQQININACPSSGYNLAISQPYFLYSGNPSNSLNFTWYAETNPGAYSPCNGYISKTNPVDSPTSCGPGQIYFTPQQGGGASCVSTTSYTSGGGSTSNVGIADIHSTLSQSQKNTQLTNKQLADLINVIRNSSVGASTIPVSLSDPVTEQDVQSYKDKKGITSNPTIDDLLKPNSNATNTNPLLNDLSLPQEGTNKTTPGTDSTLPDKNVTEVKVDLGPDPGIGEPKLEDIPTAQMILEPILSIATPFKNLNFNINGSCPTGQADLLGHHFVLDGHCAIFDTYSSSIRTIMSAVFAISAVIILLLA